MTYFGGAVNRNNKNNELEKKKKRKNNEIKIVAFESTPKTSHEENLCLISGGFLFQCRPGHYYREITCGFSQ
jgi:hypothetical protein